MLNTKESFCCVWSCLKEKKNEKDENEWEDGNYMCVCVFYPQRYIINRVSYIYLDLEAVFQLSLFVKSVIWWNIVKLLYYHEVFLHSHFIVYIAMHTFSIRWGKGFDKKH
jgi:hypothetical protein